MQNRIDAVLTAANRDKILENIAEAKTFLPFLIDLSPEERQQLFKMGDWARPIVEQTLVMAEQDDSFLPRSFDVAEMRQDKDLYDTLSPIFIQVSRLYEALQDTMMLIGSDLIVAGLDIYGNGKENGRGEHLDNLIPLVARRFKGRGKKDDGNGSDDGENGGNNPPQS